MHPNTQILYTFLLSCSGNWRNAVFVSTKDTPGYLLAADRDGKPIVMAVEQFQRFAGEQIDPAECCGQLTQVAFQVFYAQYLLWQLPDDRVDALAALSYRHER